MIGDGCCAYVSICLGANEKENTNKSNGSAVILTVAAMASINNMIPACCSPCRPQTC